MDRKTIQSILQDAVEHEIPSSQIDLLPYVKEHLVAGTNQQGEKMNSTNPRRMSRVALVTLAVFAFLTIALITPQGRAFAQSVLQFFTRAESNSFPVEVIRPDVSQPTVEAPASLLTVAEAERVTGFGLAELPFVPEGFNYLGVRMYGAAASLEYEVQGGGGNLILMQSKDGFVQSDWDKVPAEAVVPVKIDDVDGEFAQGTFVVMAGETSATWNPSAPVLRLRWVKDGVWFDLTKFGDVEAIEYLDQAGLISLASRVTTNPFPLTIKEAKQYAGYEVLIPEILPEGMNFLGAAIDPALKMTSLSIGYSEAERIILIKQQPVESPETCTLCGLVGVSASVQQVQVNGIPGEYAEGVWELTDSGPVWRDDPYLKTLRWQKDGMAYELIYMGVDLQKDNLVGIAGSMR